MTPTAPPRTPAVVPLNSDRLEFPQLSRLEPCLSARKVCANKPGRSRKP